MLLTAKAAKTGEPENRPCRSAAPGRLAPSAIPRRLRNIAAIALLTSALSACADTTLPDKLALLDLLRQQDFETLEAHLTGYQEAFEAGRISDEVVQYAFWAFASADPDLEARLDEWVTETEGSYASLLSRSVYYTHLSGVARGYELYVDTPRQRWNEMEKYELVAMQDASRAVQANPRLSVAYNRLYNLSRGMGRQRRVNRSLVAEFLQQGLKATPHSFLLHATYLNSLTPLNGGSMEEIKALMEAMERRAQPASDLGYLRAFDTFLTAILLKNRKRFDEALRLLDRVLAIEDHQTIRANKADILVDMGRLEEALAELDRAVELRPQSAGLLGRRASVRVKLRHVERALAEYDSIIELDPYNPHYLRSRSGLLAHNGRFDEAETDLDNALVYGALDPIVHYYRAKLFLYRPGRQADALAAVERALELHPNSTEFLYFYAAALSLTEVYEPHERQCRSAKVLKRFQVLCKSKGDCPSGTIATAERVLSEPAHTQAACG